MEGVAEYFKEHRAFTTAIAGGVALLLNKHLGLDLTEGQVVTCGALIVAILTHDHAGKKLAAK